MNPFGRRLHRFLSQDAASRNVATAGGELPPEQERGAQVKDLQDYLAQVSPAPPLPVTLPVGRPSPARGVNMVLGRGRTAGEVVDDLMGTLAGEPPVVECDLTGMTVEGSATGEVFAPLGHYLRHWPGTILLICAPNPVVRSMLTPMTCIDRLIIHTGWEDDALVAHRLLPRVQRAALSLPPASTAPAMARDFAADALREWRLPGLATPASHVLGEFVTHVVINGGTDVAVSLSRVDTRVRIATTSTASSAARSPASSLDELREHPLTGRAQQLVHELARGWGVIHRRPADTTTWAVLDASELTGDETQGAGHVRAQPRHRGPADPDVLTELQGRPDGRHRRQNRPSNLPSTS